MKITVFTRNQPRHLALISGLAEIADEVYAIQECNTIFPGKVADFYRQSPVMQKYFAEVIAAEKKLFGTVRFLPHNVRQISIKGGDLNMLDLDVISEALAADVFVVFGASYIKGRLVDFLIEHQALNIHMGVSPYYRGSSCNFWALYDNNPALVGSTVHFLSKGLDSGSILFHALPKPGAVEPFVFTMSAVRAAFNGLLDSVKTGSWKSIEPIPQDRTKEIRYTRNSDFTDAVADEYLKRGLTSDALAKQLADAPEYPLLRAQRY